MDEKEPEKKKDPGAVAMAAKRHKSLTPERRAEIASEAAKARWGTKKKAATKKGATKKA